MTEQLDAITRELDAGGISPQLLVLLYNAISDGARPAGTTVDQGYLEGSGVEPARAMIDMIVSLRAYESSQRVLHAIDDTLGRATTSVGSATGA